MGKETRYQLTLFVDKDDSEEIERIRKKFNPIQQQLINSHVTLCREDELPNTDTVLNFLKNLDAPEITIEFGPIKRFDNNKGVLLTARGNNIQFHELRTKILTSLKMPVRIHEPHITLMHPRNSNSTDEDFEEIISASLPTSLKFGIISLIEQIDGGQWKIMGKFNLRSH